MSPFVATQFEGHAMPTKLVANTGRPTGSPASRRLRREDKIPGVVYGHGMTPLSVTVERRELRLAVSGTAGMNTLLNLQVDGKTYPAIIKELQRHPVRRTVIHIDFQQVSLDEDITVGVPIVLEGEAKAVQQAGGLVDPAMNDLEVTTKANNIPDSIVIDITDMQPGDVIRLSDITLPAGVTVALDPDTALVTALITAAEEAAEAAEGEEGEGDTEASAEGGDAAASNDAE
jgi:large subunit ribosomal protein L25